MRVAPLPTSRVPVHLAQHPEALPSSAGASQPDGCCRCCQASVAPGPSCAPRPPSHFWFKIPKLGGAERKGRKGKRQGTGGSASRGPGRAVTGSVLCRCLSLRVPSLPFPGLPCGVSNPLWSFWPHWSEDRARRGAELGSCELTPWWSSAFPSQSGLSQCSPGGPQVLGLLPA